MRLIIYDIEVFAYDWLVVFKDSETGEYNIFHNDNEAVRNFISPENVYIGFNSKEYDQYIIKGICSGLCPEEIKQLNDYIISDRGMGWQCPLIRDSWYSFNNADIRLDIQKGLSLKAIEGHLNMSVQESTVPFNLDRPLTQAELKETIFYCKHDVDATERLIQVRKDYLKTKLNLGKRADITPEKAIAMTNAKLTAAMLHAVPHDWKDGRDYVYPPNLDTSLIPSDILAFFDTIHDTSIPDDVLFKTEFKTVIGDMPCKFAWGGVHGSLLGYREKATDERVIRNSDVSSLYPSLIEGYGYLSRNVPVPQLFFDIRRERIEAKHNGDEQTATDLKLPLNTVSGAQENKYNDLYDPLPTRSLRISGQLFLTMLTIQLLNACKTIKLLNLNTDGLMYSIDKTELPVAEAILAAWEQTTGFELETDDIDRVWIKDVNNLLLVKTNGKVKKVGGYLNHGISVKGAWSINNSAIIVKEAITAFFVDGVPVEDTITACSDIFQFQIIAKAGAKYKEAYHMVGDEKQSVQKVNRVYATPDVRYGKLFKVKAENDATAKIEMLPEHCIIDNDNELSIEDIDKSFYIQMAKKRVNDFLGIKPEKKGRKKTMATTTTKKDEPTTPMSVYQKLSKARVKFLEADVKKTGKNMHLSFKYYELDDIVPTITRIFDELGLFSHVSFGKTDGYDEAVLTVINTDVSDKSDTTQFALPMVELTGNNAVIAIQALGASVTYYRRYLYMMALDICENDGIDPSIEKDTPAKAADAPAKSTPSPAKAATPKPAATPDKSLTSADGNATDLQIRQLKDALKKLKAADPSREDYIAQIAIDTTGFTNISKKVCEELIIQISDMIESGD